MNQNNKKMNIAEILKDVPRGTKLYSPAFGEVTFKEATGDVIIVDDSCGIERIFFSDGRFYKDSECVLFLSRENRDWDTFKKFDITTLKPFDKVLVRDYDKDRWKCEFYSHFRIYTDSFKYVCSSGTYQQCIPYNIETKHLVGTDKNCSKYYKTW